MILFISISCFVLYYTRNVKEESLTVIDSLGYQITTNYVVGRKTLFIPYHQVQSIFINEVIYRWQILHVLTIMTKDTCNGNKLVPLFWEVKPRLHCLEDIYKHLRITR